MLLGQTRFVLHDGQWKRFMEALDRPPRADELHVRADPLQREAAVVEVSGPAVARAQAVGDGDADEAGRGEVEHERAGLHVLAAEDPGAAVDLKEHGSRRPGVARPVDVEAVAGARGPVREVADALDRMVRDGQGAK